MSPDSAAAAAGAADGAADVARANATGIAWNLLVQVGRMRTGTGAPRF
ncbi:MAG TPA: hypothetical protein VMH61_06190 [Candidatus Acidoferrales bacterium]|nr:hypothetical protein [Candidatus Acidoferrales bacterium]